MDYFHLSAPKQDLLNMSSLACLPGDAVYEVMVRAWLCLHGKLTPGRQHKAALAYVAAPRQAALLERILPLLTQEGGPGPEAGAERQPHSYPKGATRQEYLAATGLETLFGWLYLRGETDRLNTLFETMMEGEG